MVLGRPGWVFAGRHHDRMVRKRAKRRELIAKLHDLRAERALRQGQPSRDDACAVCCAARGSTRSAGESVGTQAPGAALFPLGTTASF
jgi:hypothetical protein